MVTKGAERTGREVKKTKRCNGAAMSTMKRPCIAAAFAASFGVRGLFSSPSPVATPHSIMTTIGVTSAMVSTTGRDWFLAIRWPFAK
eukprot:4553461-Prymnesium_polylepis.1